MKPAYLAVLGHSNIDIQLELSELPSAGQSTPVKERRMVYGGTAANIARHAAGLGVTTRLWSRVGRDFPEDWRQGLESDGVDLAWLEVDPEAATPTCTILTNSAGEQAYCMDQAAMIDLVAHPVPRSILTGLSGWLHVGTGDPRGYQDVVTAARDAGIKVAFDPGQELRFQYDEAILRWMLERADQFFCNEFELGVACTIMGCSPEELPVSRIIETRGAAGAVLWENGEQTVVPAAKSTVVDPTGAGDAFRAGWYAAIGAGASDEEALLAGNRAAGQCIGFAGPQSQTLRV